MKSAKEMLAFADKVMEAMDRRSIDIVDCRTNYCQTHGGFGMSVESVSGIVSGASTENGASVLVAKKALDVQKQQGAATVRLIESAKVEGQKGYNLDVMG